MRSKTPLHLLWLVPLVMAALVSLRSAVAHEEAPCALALGQTNAQQGSTLGNHLEILSWNIQKASNTGWAEDLARLSAEGVDLAFIQEALGTGPDSRGPCRCIPILPSGYTTAQRVVPLACDDTRVASAPGVHCQLTARWSPGSAPRRRPASPSTHGGKTAKIACWPVNLHAINFDLGLQRFHAQFEALTHPAGPPPGARHRRGRPQ